MNPVLRSIGSISTVVGLVASLTLATDSVVVARGDTLGSIAAAHQVSVAQLVEWNGITNPDLILTGSNLVVGPTADSQIDNTHSNPGSYVVVARDSLSVIAQRFRVAINTLIELNSITNPNLIFVGQDLKISPDDQPAPEAESQPAAPSGSTSHTIAAGETLSRIAANFGVGTAQLAQANGITNLDRIVSGRVLIIPTLDESPIGPDPVTVDEPAAAPTPVAQDPPAPPSAVPTPPEAAPPPVVSTPDPVAVGSTSLSPLFEKWSAAYAVPRGLLEALAWKESNWRPDAVGPAGHLGIAQLSPATVDFVESNLLGRHTDPLDPSDGIQLAARYLRYLLDRTPTQRDALAAWAQGLQGVLSDGPSESATIFADSVLAIKDARA